MPHTSPELINRINASIAHLRPFLQADGGDIEVLEVTEEMVVKVRLLGSCTNCPFSFQTLKGGVEQTLRKDIPEIKEVIAVE
ncbi:MAG: NifU family protein [Bacteroidota bacterium]|nr:NifU family protein [Bacteroidota bacterium]